MLPWGLPGCQVALAAHTQALLYAEPFSNGFWYKTPSWFTTQPQQSTNITLHHSLRTFNLFPWPDRWTVPTSPQYLSPSLHSCMQYPTLSLPTSLLIVMKATCKIASLHPQTITHENRIVECSPYTLGLSPEQSIKEKIFCFIEVSNWVFRGRNSPPLAPCYLTLSIGEFNSWCNPTTTVQD